MALILNWIMALQVIYYFLKLKDDYNISFLKYWKKFFLLFALSTFFGGLSHLLFEYFGMTGKIPGWISGMLAISCIELSMASLFADQKKRNWQYFIIGRFFLTSLLLSMDFQFYWVMIHTSIGLLGVLGTNSTIGLFQGKTYFRFYLVGILALVFALPFKVMAIDLHLWFNRDDISHIFMIIANYSFYKGIKETLINVFATSAT